MRALLAASLTFSSLALLPSASCASSRPRIQPPPAAPAAAKPVEGLVDVGDGVVAWVSSPWTFSTTSYAIVAPDGLVLIDTQFLAKDAVAFVDAVEKHTGKKALAAVVLHANPDKFNGTAALQARGIDVVTSQQVAALIPAVHEKRLRAFGKRYAPDYPTEAARPRVFGDATTALTLAGATIQAHVVGAGCSAAHVVVEHGGHVFAGDLVANGTHAWLEIGEMLEWHKRLDEMSALKPRRVHPGRGLSAGPELLTQQRAYLDDVVAAVAAERPAGWPPPEGALARAKGSIIAKHAALRFPVFLELGLPAEWRRQAGLAKNSNTEHP